MKFAAFYFMGGMMCAVGAIRTTADESGFGWLFFGAFAAVALGALFEACNPQIR